MFAAIADERRALADLLETLTPAQLATPSLCEAWTVRDVAGHLVMPLVTGLPAFAGAMLRARGNFNAASEALTARVVAEQGDRLPALLREHAASRFTPPGSGPMAPLTDVFVHGQDIRRPLGIAREADAATMVAILDFLASPAATRGFTRKDAAAGVRLEASDLGWARGHGPVVSGTAEALALALTGRRVAYADLTGDGVGALTRQ